MYRIKQIPEDFVVREVIRPILKREGDFAYFTLKKRNYSTLRAAEKTAELLNIPLKFIGFAGTKDKNAVTEQMISVKSINAEKLEDMKVKDLSYKLKGFSFKPLSLGDLEGNNFEITVRNLDSFDEFEKKGRFLNLFGEQRFSKNNSSIGKAIIKKEFKKALDLILENERDYKAGIEEALKKSPNDYIGALRRIPKKLLLMYIHSYQSLLWNKTALKLKDEKENIKVPIIGFGSDIDEIKDERVKSIVKEIMDEEKLTERDFIIRELQGLSPEGDKRDLFAEVRKLRVIEKSEDELNKGKKKIRISFFLKKGCYATEAIKAMFKNQ
ncbi:tRNA pseudouridine(13) synthase TruD [Candidatus Woesearchaeota archaeon]|nr:tRNA pseudouridine(13) synthase TruD [Candidatus Woesearchaeota archaeon]